METITCTDCGAVREVHPQNWASFRCLPCQALAKRQADKDGARRRAAARRGTRECPFCGERFTPKTMRSPHCGALDCRRQHDVRRQKEFQTQFAQRTGTPYTVNRNPELRQRASAERRARTRGARVGAPFTRQYIGERDSWQCALCGQPIDPTLKWPNPMSQSLEHIVPLALGGAHSKENCTIAHLSCNSRGGTRHAQARARMLDKRKQRP